MDNKIYLTTIYLGYFIGVTIFSLLINGLFLKFAKTLGIRNNNETIIRWGSLSKPALGGISFYLIFLLSITSYNIFFDQSKVLLNKQLLGILSASTLAFMAGLADDAYNTRPLLKFSAQLLCALLLIVTGTYITLFDNIYLNYLLTVIWVIGIMNSINMLDNMDAITTTVSIVTVFGALLILYFNHDYSNVYIIILIGILGSLLGFLFFNWHPSKLYMGDTGSQFLGLFLAAIGIIYFWDSADVNGNKVPSKQFIVTILAFIIPLIDTFTVIVNRISKGKSPFVGGKDHTTHHLFYWGITEKRIALLFAGISMTSIFFMLYILKFSSSWNYVDIMLSSFYCLLVFSLLFLPTKIKKKDKNVI